MSDKKNKKLFTYILLGAVVFLIGYLLFTTYCNSKKEGLDATTQVLMDTVGGNSDAETLMTTTIPLDFQQASRNDLAEDDALKFFCEFNGDSMRIGKTLAYQDAMVNRYSKLKDMMY